jgi:predicted MFS family arabinose efflux permease
MQRFAPSSSSSSSRRRYLKMRISSCGESSSSSSSERTIQTTIQTTTKKTRRARKKENDGGSRRSRRSRRTPREDDEDEVMMMMRNESKTEEHQNQHQHRREGGRAAGEMSAAFLGEKEKNLTTMGLDDGYRYNRHRDRSERFDLSSKLTEFYPSYQSFQPFGEDPEKNAQESEKWLKIVERINSPKSKATFTLSLLTFAYVHCAASGFLVSALLPAIGGDLELSDGQGALLTTLFTVVYSLCLPLIGLAADKTNRKNLLAAGAAIWTAGTVMTANANTFTELVVARIVFAIGNGPQNPIAFSLLPELFPRNKNAAMSLYNMGVHFGRAISFASGAMVAAPQMATDSVFNPDLPITMPIEFLSDIKNLGSHTILYVTGDSVVLSPNAGTAMESVGDALMANTGLGWRELFEAVAIPGFIIAPALFFIVTDPGRSKDGSSRAVRRKQRRSQKRMSDAKRLIRKARFSGVLKDEMTGKSKEKLVSDLNIVSLVASYDEDETTDLIMRKVKEKEEEAVANVTALVMRKAIKADEIEDLSDIIESRVDYQMKKEGEQEKKEESFFDSAVNRFKNPNFRALTLAATLTDVASWSMIAFQATFYQRTYGLEASEYNHLLAFVIPVSGAIGGLTSGYFSDRLNAFQRKLMVAGGTILCAPLIAESLESSSYQLSMTYLFFGFMFSEFFRSPTAVMTRELDPENPSATVAAHLAVRNLTAGLGPLAVAALISKGGLEIKDAMLFAPVMYILAGVAFWYADSLIEKTKAEKQKRKSLQAVSR